MWTDVSTDTAFRNRLKHIWALLQQLVVSGFDYLRHFKNLWWLIDIYALYLLSWTIVVQRWTSVNFSKHHIFFLSKFSSPNVAIYSLVLYS